jgi:DNA invertase Pin-like site-specific DNA recombinase
MQRKRIFKRILSGSTGPVKVNITWPPYEENVKMINEHKINLKFLSPTEKSEAVTKYENGMSITKIANLYGCHRTTVSRILKIKGISIR